MLVAVAAAAGVDQLGLDVGQVDADPDAELHVQVLERDRGDVRAVDRGERRVGSDAEPGEVGVEVEAVDAPRVGHSSSCGTTRTGTGECRMIFVALVPRNTRRSVPALEDPRMSSSLGIQSTEAQRVRPAGAGRDDELDVVVQRVAQPARSAACASAICSRHCSVTSDSMSVPISGGYIVADRTPNDATRSWTSISRVSRAAQRTADAGEVGPAERAGQPVRGDVGRCSARTGTTRGAMASGTGRGVQQVVGGRADDDAALGPVRRRAEHQRGGVPLLRERGQRARGRAVASGGRTRRSGRRRGPRGARSAAASASSARASIHSCISPSTLAIDGTVQPGGTTVATTSTIAPRRLRERAGERDAQVDRAVRRPRTGWRRRRSSSQVLVLRRRSASIARCQQGVLAAPQEVEREHDGEPQQEPRVRVPVQAGQDVEAGGDRRAPGVTG